MHQGSNGRRHNVSIWGPKEVVLADIRSGRDSARARERGTQAEGDHPQYSPDTSVRERESVDLQRASQRRKAAATAVAARSSCFPPIFTAYDLLAAQTCDPDPTKSTGKRSSSYSDLFDFSSSFCSSFIASGVLCYYEAL